MKMSKFDYCLLFTLDIKIYKLHVYLRNHGKSLHLITYCRFILAWRKFIPAVVIFKARLKWTHTFIFQMSIVNCSGTETAATCI